MKRTWKKTLALLLGLVLAASLLPATGAAEASVSGDEARQSVLARVSEITDVRWALDSKRIEWGKLTEEDNAAMYAAGCFPSTWFEYGRMHFTFKGMIMSTDTASPEEFSDMLDPSVNYEPGVPTYHNALTMGHGLDVNTFLSAISSRVLKTPLTGVKAALSDPGVTALAKADASAASSKAALGSAAAAAEGYAKLGAGDLLLAWDDAADPAEKPYVHAMVVKSADPAAKKVTVIYPSYSKVMWYFTCDTCGKREMEGPTSAVCPEHVKSTASKTFERFLTHKESDASTGCGGMWQPEYGTVWREETLTYDQLFGTGSAAVPCGSAGYVPCTFAAYQTGLAPAAVGLETSISPDNYTAGFTARVTSDYVIAGARAVLTEQNGQKHEYVAAADRGSRTLDWKNKELDLDLLACKEGTKNDLSFYVRTGPMGRDDEGDWKKILGMEFTVQSFALRLAADRTKADQGESFVVSVQTIGAGYTGVRARVAYDRDSYVFDLAASRAKSPNVTITEQDGTITCLRLGQAMNAGAEAAALVFAPVRRGLFPADADANGTIRGAGAEATQKASPTEADLTSSGIDSTPVRMATGYDTQIFKNYCGEYDLILVYTMTETQRTDNRNSKTKLAYDGLPMYDVTRAKYAVDGEQYLRTYAYLAKNASSARVAAGTADCPELACDNDVNCSGHADLNDVQTVANIIKGSLDPQTHMAKCLTADIDRSGRVDRNDVSALWSALSK